MERRTLSLDFVDVRAEPGSRFTGHAATFTRYAYMDPTRFGWWEEMAKGAFDRAISEDQDVRFLVNHDPNTVLARTASGTMTLGTDKRGLTVNADLADTGTGRDLRILLQRGDVSQMSIAFDVKHDEWKDQKDGSSLRIIHDLDLWDVSAVTYPANPDTDASLRSAAENAGYTEVRRQRWETANQRFRQLPSRGY